MLHPLNSARRGAVIIAKNNTIHYEREDPETEKVQSASIRMKTEKHTTQPSILRQDIK